MYAKAQLQFISQYMNDFEAIKNNVTKRNEVVAAQIKAKRDNNEIIWEESLLI